MTIANNYVLTKQATNGSTTVFSFSFYALNADYIKVVKETDDVQTVVDPSDYTVSFDENGGTVTFGTAPAAGSYIIVYRETPKEQETPFATSSGFPAKTMEGKLDKLTAMVQEDSEALDRSIKYPKGSSGSMLLPVPDAGRAIVWNETEDGLANSTLDLEYLAESVPNINKCAENEQNINAAVANEANINAAVANQSNINTVATNISNVNATGGSIANVNAVSSDLTNIDTVAGELTDISTVAGIASDVTSVASIASDVTAVNSNKTNINKVAGDINRVGLVADDIDSVHTVAVDISNVIDVAGNKTNIDAVAADLTNVDTVAGSITDVGTVATNISDVGAVATGITDVGTVATNIADVGTVATNISDVNDCADNMQAITDAPTYAQEAKDWANKTGGTVDGSEYSAKHYAEQAVATLNNKIDRRYAIEDIATNCITEIPQDINLTLSSGTLTLKSGSVVTFPDGTQSQTTEDKTATSSTDGTYFVFLPSSGNIVLNLVSKTASGSSLPADGTTYEVFYNTTDGKLYKYNWVHPVHWDESTLSCPLAIITVSGGAISSIDKIFNGAGYIGHTFFVLPGITGLAPNGRSADGSYNAIEITEPSLHFYTISTTSHTNIVMVVASAGGVGAGAYYRQETLADSGRTYIPSQNRVYQANGTEQASFPILSYDNEGETITRFEMFPVSGLDKHNVENALGYTPENVTNKVTSISGSSTDTQYPSAKLLYDTKTTLETSISGKQATLTFDATPTASSTNPVTSGGVYTALAGKQTKATYDSTNEMLVLA